MSMSAAVAPPIWWRYANSAAHLGYQVACVEATPQNSTVTMESFE